jgi:hypothetical protein
MTARHLPAGDWRLAVYGRGGGQGGDQRRKPRKRDRDRVIAIQGNNCLYCELPIGVRIWRRANVVTLQPHWDHFVPFSYLLRNPETNWVLACHVCNGLKGSRVFESVHEARERVLPARLAKGYEDVISVMMRLSLDAGSDLWPLEFRRVSGDLVHYGRLLRDGIRETGCGLEIPVAQTTTPTRNGRVCRRCIVRRDVDNHPLEGA